MIWNLFLQIWSREIDKFVIEWSSEEIPVVNTFAGKWFDSMFSRVKMGNEKASQSTTNSVLSTNIRYCFKIILETAKQIFVKKIMNKETVLEFDIILDF